MRATNYFKVWVGKQANCEQGGEGFLALFPFPTPRHPTAEDAYRGALLAQSMFPTGVARLCVWRPFEEVSVIGHETAQGE